MAINTDLNALLLNEIYQMYSQAEIRMLEKVAKKVKNGIVQPGWAEEKLADVQKMRAEVGKMMNDTNTLAKKKLDKGIIAAYFKGISSASKDHKIPRSAMNDVIPEHLQRLILDMNNLIDGTNVQILRNVDDVYRKVMSETTTGVLTGVDTRLQAAQRSLDMFAARGVTGFVDNVGRRWDLASYVEMAGRTTSAHAAIQGHIDRQGEIGNDLMIVSSFGATCPICAPWEGRVLSISGDNKKYSSIDDARAAGLFHPNCKHTITAYFSEIDEENVGPLHEHKRPYNPELYEATQTQRYNERQIRKWKRVESVAIVPEAQVKASQKVRYWQAVQRQHVDNWNLRRKYVRESINKRAR